MILIVAAAAAAAIVLVVGGTVLQADQAEPTPPVPQQPRPRGAPPLLLDLGLSPPRDLRNAVTLYGRGERAEASRIFRRHGDVASRIGAAFAAWPDGTLVAIDRLRASWPRDAQVRLHRGLALFWSGRRGEAVAAWRAAVRVQPDSISAVRADDLLHPNSPRGLPTFVPSFAPPAAIVNLSPDRQLAALARAATNGGVREKLLYGVALQRTGFPVSAERQYAAAAALDPANVEAQVAVAVGRYRKGDPARAFAGLGPLSGRFPRNPSVRFHLGLLLLWGGQLDEAERQLELARAAGPDHPLGREANRFLRRLESIRTS